MTLRGIFAIIFELCLLIMALGTDIRDFLIVAVCIGGLLLFSFLSVLIAGFTLRYKTSTEKASFTRQDGMSFDLNISGICFLPVICKIIISPPFYEENKSDTPLCNSFIIDFLRFNRNYSFNLNCINTGHWSVGIEHITINDIFGFFNYSFFLTKGQRSADITVLPKYHPIPELSNGIDTDNEYIGASLQNSELGEILSDSREYIVGDPLRRINWKQSAKTGKLFTRMFEKAEEPKAIIAIDCFSDDNTGNTQDICREAALFLSEYFMSVGFSIQIVTLRSEVTLSAASFRDLKDCEDLRISLTDIVFKAESNPLLPTDIDSGDFFDGDKVFIISANPDASLFDDSFTVKFGIETKMIIAGNIFSSPMHYGADTGENTRYTFVTEPQEITEKVGELL